MTDVAPTSESLRVLYLEDNPTDADLVRRDLARLSPGLHLQVVPTVQAAIAALASEPPPFELVLSDMQLPDGSGLELLAHIRQRDLPLAVVMLTGTSSHELAVSVLRAGADDYLVKRGDYRRQLPQVLSSARERFLAARTLRARPLQVLYAEDNPFDADLTRRHLARYAPHLQLTLAATGGEALELLRAPEAAFDLLLTDYQLPGVGGLELVKAVRDELRLELPVVLITGQGSEEVVAEALRLGVADYLIKHEGYLEALPVVLEKAFRQAQLWREQAALRASEARFRGLFEGNLAVMLLIDPDTGALVDANPAAAAFYGWSVEQLRRMSIFQINTLPEAEERLVLQRLLAGERHSFFLHHRRADGSVREVEVYAGPVPAGQRQLLCSIIHDITDRRRAEERQRLDAAALNSSRDAVMITDLAPAILAVNPAFTEMTGYAEAEVLGADPRLLQSDRHDRAFYQALWLSLQQSGEWQGEVWNRRKGGEVYPLWLSLSTVRDEAGEPTHYVGVATDLTPLRRSEEQREWLTHHDPLTGLPNRLLLEARLQHSLERAHRLGGHIGVVVLDLDQFKAINESYGLAVGDELLVKVVERLRQRTRAEDTLARMGGDQFVMVLEGVRECQDIEAVAHMLQAELAEPFALPDGQPAYLRASIGISLHPEDGDTPQALLHGADTAMHQAKERGGGQLCYYTPELNAQARTALELEVALRGALERQELVLHYQPKVDLRSGHVAGAEALVRWRREEGLVPPDRFIPLAEKSGLIIGLGAWVIREACRQMRQWREDGLPPMRVAVNVSARQFRSPELEGIIAEALAANDIEPGDLMLELTESMLMDDPEQAKLRLGSLHRTGVRLALDDFGTGYSSLRYLSQFAIDQLKIDRSFVSEVVTDPGAATIATAIIALAHRMRIGVVAEGVETEGQLGYLRRNGCDEIQGFYISRPLPPADFAALVQRGLPPLPPLEEARQRTLLLVDDEPRVLKALRRQLSKEGYRILQAGSGPEALDLLARHRVQVIVSDQRMPEMSGTELLGRVKALHPETVRMILSGYADLDTVTRSVNEGTLDKFIAKPWDDDTLREQVRDAFRYYDEMTRRQSWLQADCPSPGSCPGRAERSQ